MATVSDRERIVWLLTQLEKFALGKTRCDITTFTGEPHIDVLIDPKFFYALMYGAGAAKMSEILNAIQLSDGTSVTIKEIWTIHPMPPEGLSNEALSAVDLTDGDEVAGPNGETIRQMIARTYKCKSPDEEEKYLRRYLAS
jgi:hypothetical protein